MSQSATLPDGSTVTVPPGYTITVSQIQPPPPPQLGSITINPSATSIQPGQSVTFTGKYLDTNGNGIGTKPLYSFVDGVQSGAAFDTAADGSYSVTIQFPTAGTFQVDLSDNSNNS